MFRNHVCYAILEKKKTNLTSNDVFTVCNGSDNTLTRDKLNLNFDLCKRFCLFFSFSLYSIVSFDEIHSKHILRVSY